MIMVYRDTKDFPVAVLCIDHTMTHFQNIVANQSLSTLCTKNNM